MSTRCFSNSKRFNSRPHDEQVLYSSNFQTSVKVTFLTRPRTTHSIYMSIMHMFFDAYVYQAQSRRWAYEGASS